MAIGPFVWSNTYGIAAAPPADTTAAVIAAELPALFTVPGRGPSERYGMTVFWSKV